jgi:hypothetical protein
MVGTLHAQAQQYIEHLKLAMQASVIGNCPGPAKADRPKRRGCAAHKKGWEDVAMIELNRGDDTSIPYAVGDDVYICGPKFDTKKKPLSANFAQPACLICCIEATTEEDAANLVECSRCTYPVHLACNSPPLFEVPKVHSQHVNLVI